MTIPPGGAVSVDDSPRSGRDGDVFSPNVDHITVIVAVSKGLLGAKMPRQRSRRRLLNVLLTVVPAKTTVVPVFSLDKFKAVDEGTAIFDRVSVAQEAVAAATLAKAVTVHELAA